MTNLASENNYISQNRRFILFLCLVTLFSIKLVWFFFPYFNILNLIQKNSFMISDTHYQDMVFKPVDNPLHHATASKVQDNQLTSTSLILTPKTHLSESSSQRRLLGSTTNQCLPKRSSLKVKKWLMNRIWHILMHCLRLLHQRAPLTTQHKA